MNRSGVRYMTEDFIKISAHEDRLDRIKKLNLDCGKEDKQIRYIEHMDNLNNLLVLSIRFHAIEKIEKLDKLVNLKELYLNENKINKLDGLENLTHLKILDIRGNQITTIPYWFTRRCKYLTKINFSRNLFESIEEISKLWNLKDLLDLDVSENPVTSVLHYRAYIIMRFKFLQILDNREVTSDERKAALEQFEESELDRLKNRLIETEKQLGEVQQSQQQLQKDCVQQENYQKDLHKKQKSNIEKIKELEENLKSKDILLKKKSEDLFRACQKYYDLEQDIAFIKIDAKFDLLSNNIGPLEEPDNLSEYSQISSAGDQAYMGKGQFITKREANLLLERQRERQNHMMNNRNGNEKSITDSKLRDEFFDSLNDKVKEKLKELKQIDQEITEKNRIVDQLNNEIEQRDRSNEPIISKKTMIPGFIGLDRPRSALDSANRISPFKSLFNRSRRFSDASNNSQINDHSNMTNKFLEKVENLTEMQKEAEELRRQMESTEKESMRQQKDIGYLRNQLEKFKTADPNLAHHIENEVREKEFHVDENLKLYEDLSKRLDELSLAIEKSMKDIQETEVKLLEDNRYFTDDLRNKIRSVMSQLTDSLSNQNNQNYKRVLDKYKEKELENDKLQYLIMQQKNEIDALQSQIQNDGNMSSRRSARSIDDEVEGLRKELNKLRQDALAAKDDLESEIEMEKVLNNELQKQIDDLKQNEENILCDLELQQEKHEKIIEKIKADKFLMQDSAEQQIMNFQDDMMHRIKVASETPMDNLEKSKNPIDKALLQLIQSICRKNTNDDEDAISPTITKINDDLQQIKIQLKEVNRNISSSPPKNLLEPTFDENDNSNLNGNDQILPIKRMLSKSFRHYNNEMQEIKARIKDLHDLLTHGIQHRKKHSKVKASERYKTPSKMLNDTSIDYSDSEESYPVKKSRAQSQDRIPKRTSNTASSSKKWKSLQQGISSDEQAIFDTIQDELNDLMHRLEIAEERNEYRIEKAMNQIAEIQRRSQNKNDEIPSKGKNEHLNREKENLTEYLRETMSQVERCQDDIKRLNERLMSKIPNSKEDSENKQFGSEIDKMGFILQSQKAEIERLNNLLEKVTQSGTPNFSQSSQLNPPVINPLQPSEPFVPHSFLPLNQNSFSTPMLNNNAYVSNFCNQIKNSSSLFCNVPEHHYLEDYFQTNNGNKSSWKMKRKFRSDSAKYLNTLETIQDDINKKNEELDNIEIQISKQTHEIGRLNYQIEQLNFTKQDLLDNISSLRQETELVTRESIANTSESLGHLRARKSLLTEEINESDVKIRKKRDELMHTDAELKKSNLYLTQIQEQTSETLKRHDEARMNHRKLILECEELERKSKEASFELAKAMSNLNCVQNEISNLSSNKTNLEEVLLKIQTIINQKDQEFQKLMEEINKANQNLNALQTELNMTSEQNREKMHMLSEGDQLLADTRLELNRLKNEILLSQEHLKKMESEIGERNVSIDIASSELERSKQIHHRLIQEHQNEQTKIKRELSDLKFDLESMKDEKNDLINIIENSKMKILQLKDNIDKQEQTRIIHQSDFEKLNWQTEHVDNILKLKQSQLDKVLTEYQSKIIDLEKIEEDNHQQQVEFKKLDTDIKRKASEVDKLRQTIATENESLQRVQFDKDNLESSISTLSKEKNLLKNEKKELESNVKLLKKQESLTQDSLLSIESKVSQARTELEKMHSEKCSETIKRDELKMQSNNLSKHLHESKCELQSIKERLTMIEVQCDERTTEIRKKMQLQSSLNIEIRKLQDQLRLANMSFDEMTNQEQLKKEKICGLNGDISRKTDEIKNLEKKISDLQNSVIKEDNKLEKILKSSSSELEQLKLEISEKLENLEATGNKLQQVKKDIAIKEFTEQKIFELEEMIRQQRSNIDQYEQENRSLSNHLSIVTRDLGVLRQSHQYEMENKDKEMARLKKRLSKEIFQLEKLAEDQCNRANNLTDDLNQARRDYILLRNRIVIFGRFLDKESTCLAQEHFIEQQNLFKEYMQPNTSKLLPSWETTIKPDGVELPLNVEAALLTENRRHLQNQLNLLKENIASATQVAQNGISQYKYDSFNNLKNFESNLKWNTASSGLGSTLDHTGNSSDTFLENDRVKKALHTQFNEDVEKINKDNARCEDLCNQLRNEVEHLKSSLPSEKSPSSLSE